MGVTIYYIAKNRVGVNGKEKLWGLLMWVSIAFGK